MQPQSIDANNTGNVNIAAGFQPESSVTGPNAGAVLIQSAFILKSKDAKTMTKKWQGQIWARSSVANQSIVVEEDIEEPEPKE